MTRVHAAETAPLTLDHLDGVRAVVLENVPLADLPAGAAAALASYVRDLGGGLLMTGGRASFGPGGYHGLGQRMLATDTEEFPLMDIRKIVLDAPSPDSPAE